MKRLRVYVAGPLTAMTDAGMEANVRNAMQVADELMKRGHAPFVPHLSHFANAVHPHAYREWLEVDFAWVTRSDVLFMIADSPGTRQEVMVAAACRIPVVRSLEALDELVARAEFEDITPTRNDVLRELEAALLGPKTLMEVFREEGAAAG